MKILIEGTAEEIAQLIQNLQEIKDYPIISDPPKFKIKPTWEGMTYCTTDIPLKSSDKKVTITTC